MRKVSLGQLWKCGEAGKERVSSIAPSRSSQCADHTDVWARRKDLSSCRLRWLESQGYYAQAVRTEMLNDLRH